MCLIISYLKTPLTAKMPKTIQKLWIYLVIFDYLFKFNDEFGLFTELIIPILLVRFKKVEKSEISGLNIF